VNGVIFVSGYILARYGTNIYIRYAQICLIVLTIGISLVYQVHSVWPNSMFSIRLGEEYVLQIIAIASNSQNCKLRIRKEGRK
jgi:hypothetical protein